MGHLAPLPILSPPVLPLISGTKRPPQIPRTLWGWHTPGGGTGTTVLVSSSHCPTNSVSNPHPQQHSISSSGWQLSRGNWHSLVTAFLVPTCCLCTKRNWTLLSIQSTNIYCTLTYPILLQTLQITTFSPAQTRIAHDLRQFSNSALFLSVLNTEFLHKISF